MGGLISSAWHPEKREYIFVVHPNFGPITYTIIPYRGGKSRLPEAKSRKAALRGGGWDFVENICEYYRLRGYEYWTVTALDR